MAMTQVFCPDRRQCYHSNWQVEKSPALSGVDDKKMSVSSLNAEVVRQSLSPQCMYLMYPLFHCRGPGEFQSHPLWVGGQHAVPGPCHQLMIYGTQIHTDLQYTHTTSMVSQHTDLYRNPVHTHHFYGVNVAYFNPLLIIYPILSSHPPNPSFKGKYTQNSIKITGRLCPCIDDAGLW